MNRHYYISDNLDELERLEQELQASGISAEQIHVLTEQDADVEQHSVNSVPSMMKTDMVNSGRKGLYVGLVLAALVLLVARFAGWTTSAAGWAPFVLLALIVVGFCAWEGGFFGIQTPNQYFQDFQQRLRDGRHVFFVDIEPVQEPLLEKVMSRHPGLEMAGTGTATPQWLVQGQQQWHRFKKMI